MVKDTGLVVLLSLQYVPHPQCISWTPSVPSFLFCLALESTKNYFVLIFQTFISLSVSCHPSASVLGVLFRCGKIITSDHLTVAFIPYRDFLALKENLVCRGNQAQRYMLKLFSLTLFIFSNFHISKSERSNSLAKQTVIQEMDHSEILLLSWWLRQL